MHKIIIVIALLAHSSNCRSIHHGNVMCNAPLVFVREENGESISNADVYKEIIADAKIAMNHTEKVIEHFVNDILRANPAFYAAGVKHWKLRLPLSLPLTDTNLSLDETYRMASFLLKIFETGFKQILATHNGRTMEMATEALHRLRNIQCLLKFGMEYNQIQYENIPVGADILEEENDTSTSTRHRRDFLILREYNHALDSIKQLFQSLHAREEQ